ncbi:hypothetical protein HDU84_003865 [Entophlyctis sp. JEL0112]|nr:hypothetical protein HDU84_003865 [Entophlyctis sp. JEL0112]
MLHATPSNSIGSLQCIDIDNFEWKTASAAVNRYNLAHVIFKLDSDSVADSGLSLSTLMLYCRPGFQLQFEFLQDHVLDIGWILGPPGMGKSTTALAFASTIPKMHSIEPQLEAILERVSNKHLVIINGYAAPAERHIDAIENHMYWQSKEMASRCLCVVCSMALCGKSRVTEDVLNNIKEHFVESWSLGDYKYAVENE